MSDASWEIPKVEEPTHCRVCGVELDQDARDADRDICFACYVEEQG